MSYDRFKDYEPVENRIDAFWTKYPDGRILTDLKRTDRADGKVEWVCRTEIYTDREDARPASTGYATEIEGGKGVNLTNASENCETSSIGRGLANLNFATKGKRPSREEMMKVERAQAAYAEAPKASDTTPATAEDHTARIGALKMCKDIDTLTSVAKRIGEQPMNDAQRNELREVFLLRKAEISTAVESGEPVGASNIGS
jgi:hypothetical protein